MKLSTISTLTLASALCLLGVTINTAEATPTPKKHDDHREGCERFPWFGIRRGPCTILPREEIPTVDANADHEEEDKKFAYGPPDTPRLPIMPPIDWFKIVNHPWEFKPDTIPVDRREHDEE